MAAVKKVAWESMWILRLHQIDTVFKAINIQNAEVVNTKIKSIKGTSRETPTEDSHSS